MSCSPVPKPSNGPASRTQKTPGAAWTCLLAQILSAITPSTNLMWTCQPMSQMSTTQTIPNPNLITPLRPQDTSAPSVSSISTSRTPSIKTPKSWKSVQAKPTETRKILLLLKLVDLPPSCLSMIWTSKMPNLIIAKFNYSGMRLKDTGSRGTMLTGTSLPPVPMIKNLSSGMSISLARNSCPSGKSRPMMSVRKSSGCMVIPMFLQSDHKTNKSPSTISEKAPSNHLSPKPPTMVKFTLLTSIDLRKTSCSQATKTTKFSYGTFVTCQKSLTVLSATMTTLQLYNGPTSKKLNLLLDQLTGESSCGTSVRSVLKWQKIKSNNWTRLKRLLSFMVGIEAEWLIWDFRRNII